MQKFKDCMALLAKSNLAVAKIFISEKEAEEFRVSFNDNQQRHRNEVVEKLKSMGASGSENWPTVVELEKDDFKKGVRFLGVPMLVVSQDMPVKFSIEPKDTYVAWS